MTKRSGHDRRASRRLALAFIALSGSPGFLDLPPGEVDARLLALVDRQLERKRSAIKRGKLE